MKICRDNLPDVDLSTAEKIESREAVAMYQVGLKIYKLIRYKESIHDQQNTLQESVHSSIIQISRGKYFQDSNTLKFKDVLVIEMKKITSGNFFNISKVGGSATLIGWINSENDSERLKRISRALNAAKKAKLTDPQGFFMTTGPDPIIFIDLHCGSYENNQLDDAIARVTEKIG